MKKEILAFCILIWLLAMGILIGISLCVESKLSILIAIFNAGLIIEWYFLVRVFNNTYKVKK